LSQHLFVYIVYCANIEVKKYHSMAAKGESVDISELAKGDQSDADKETVSKDHEASPSNNMASQSIERPQTTTGAESAKKPTVTGPSGRAAQTTPAAVAHTPVAGGAIPQALLNTGNPYSC
jgi:hypothetical protein